MAQGGTEKFYFFSIVANMSEKGNGLKSIFVDGTRLVDKYEIREVVKRHLFDLLPPRHDFVQSSWSVLPIVVLPSSILPWPARPTLCLSLGTIFSPLCPFSLDSQYSWSFGFWYCS